MIQLPIEIGDTLLGGKFKNKRIVVKEIGLDEYGGPTVNGRSILKVRIPKLYKKMDENTMKSKYKEATEKFQKLPITIKIKKQDKRFCLFLQTVDGEDCLDPVGYETKELAQHAALTKGYTVDGYEPPTNVTKAPMLERLIREIISELYTNKPINELDVTDPETTKILDELGTLQEQLDNAEAEIEALKKKLNVAGLQKQIKTIINEKLNTLMVEMEKSGDRLARTENIIMKIERSAYKREDPQYKEGFLESLKKVNAATKKVLQDVLKAYTTTTNVAAKISFSRRQENVITEANIFTKFADWLTNMLGALIPKVSARGKQIDNELDRLERVLKIK